MEFTQTVWVSVGPPDIAVWHDFIFITIAYLAFGVFMGAATFALHKAPLRSVEPLRGLALALLAVLAAYFPFYLNRQFMVLFSTASHGVLVFLKIVEVHCGTSPPGLDQNMYSWIWYACH
ncbi:hypothetical protein T492DRAFT_904177 [Pavlovales sp. CCMP2436]|nr:hypothetical protein T492DRAFT_904177 [Pavlovales sp. CCMP2436]